MSLLTTLAGELNSENQIGGAAGVSLPRKFVIRDEDLYDDEEDVSNSDGGGCGCSATTAAIPTSLSTTNTSTTATTTTTTTTTISDSGTLSGPGIAPVASNTVTPNISASSTGDGYVNLSTVSLTDVLRARKARICDGSPAAVATSGTSTSSSASSASGSRTDTSIQVSGGATVTAVTEWETGALRAALVALVSVPVFF